MTVQHMWSGTLSDTGVTVKGRMSGAGSSVRLAVSLTDTITSPVYFGPATSTADNMATLTATGLTANTRYYYALEDTGVLDSAFIGSFKTHPVAVGERASYTFGAAGDAGLTGGPDAGVGDTHITTQVSNNPVFDTMRAQAVADDWAWFSHLGDLHYRNINAANTASYRAGYNDTLTFNGTLGAAARQGHFLRGSACTYVWDDHDFNGNDSDASGAGNATANAVYRERMPSYTLGANGIYQSWQVGRVLYIAADVRTFRNPNSDPQTPTKTMLGTAQKAWMEGLLDANAGGAEALVWMSPSRWVGGSDTWASFLHERAEVVQMFGDTGWLDKMIFMTADAHALSICSAGHNPTGHFPMYMFASMDSSYGTNSLADYDIGQSQGRQQYGTVDIIDKGHTIQLRGTGWINGAEWKTYSKYVHVGNTAFSMDYSTGPLVLPFEPTDDDAEIVNDVTAQRVDGSEARVLEEDGPLSVSAPENGGVGVYDDEVTVNVKSDLQLGSQAGWRVHHGTVDEARYPVMTIKLHRNPEVIASLATIDTGDKVVITDPPSWLPPDDIETIIDGYEESLSNYEWTWTASATPGTPWTVGQLPTAAPEDAGPDEPNRADTRGCTLLTAETTTSTEWLLLTSQNHVMWKHRWIISDGLDTNGNLPNEFPFDLRIDGELVRITGCKPLAWDTFTRTTANGWGTATSGHVWTTAGGTAAERTTNGTTGRVTIGSAPTTLRAQVLGETGITDCDVTFKVGVSATSTGATQSPSLLLRYVSTTDHYRARVHFTTASGVFVSVTRGATQVDSNASVGRTYAPGDMFNVRVRLAGHRVWMKVWPVGGLEPHYWHIDRTVVTDTIASGDIGLGAVALTGNTNTTSAQIFDDFEVYNPQRATVTRSINTVVRAHDAGHPISLAVPASAAL